MTRPLTWNKVRSSARAAGFHGYLAAEEHAAIALEADPT